MTVHSLAGKCALGTLDILVNAAGIYRRAELGEAAVDALNAHLFADPEFGERRSALTSLGRVGDVDDIAPAAALLVSDAAKFITGASLLVDGGVVAR